MAMLYAKRILLKPSFVILLLMVPLLVFALSLMAKEESGITRIELCAYDSSDEIAIEAVDMLLENSGLGDLHYSSVEEAFELLENGSVDSVWVLKDSLESRIMDFCYNRTGFDGLVDIYEKEDTIPLKIAREKLFAVLYKWISYDLSYVQLESVLSQNGIEMVLEDQFDTVYRSYKSDESLFVHNYLNAASAKEDDYLLTPMRGMLALLILLAGLCGTLYHKQDKENGVFDGTVFSKRIIIGIMSQLIPMIMVGIVCVLALFLSGNGTSLFREILLLAIYILEAGAFCLVLGEVFDDLNKITVITPFIILISFVLCPIFFRTNYLKAVQWVLPTTYYLRSVHNNHFLNNGILYTVVLIMIFGFIYFGKHYLKASNHKI